MKKCPYCAEKIQDEAIVCRYCGQDLPVAKDSKTRTKEQESKRNTGSIFKQAAKIALIFAILGAVGTIINFRNAPAELIGGLTIGLIANFVFWWIVISGLIWLSNRFGKWILPGIIILAVVICLGIVVVETFLMPEAKAPISIPATSTIIPFDVTGSMISTRQSEQHSQADKMVPPEIANNCLSWDKVTMDYSGGTVCVYGIIQGFDIAVYDAGANDIFYFNKGSEWDEHSFYIINQERSRSTYKVGDCIVGRGLVTGDIIGAPKFNNARSSQPCSQGLP